jgi:hypothetical protein
MLLCGTGCHMSSFVVIEEKFEVIHYPTHGPVH